MVVKVGGIILDGKFELCGKQPWNAASVRADVGECRDIGLQLVQET